MDEIWFDPDDDPAELVSALEAEGYVVTRRRELFAGEDDVEDQALVLLVDPFDEGVEALVDVYGGWLPGDVRLPASPPPDLPAEPRRLKARDF